MACFQHISSWRKPKRRTGDLWKSDSCHLARSLVGYEKSEACEKSINSEGGNTIEMIESREEPSTDTNVGFSCLIRDCLNRETGSCVLKNCDKRKSVMIKSGCKCGRQRKSKCDYNVKSYHRSSKLVRGFPTCFVLFLLLAIYHSTIPGAQTAKISTTFGEQSNLDNLVHQHFSKECNHQYPKPHEVR